MQVKLIDYARAPLEKLYAAFRTCYSADTPIEIWQKIEAEKLGTVSAGARRRDPSRRRAFHSAECRPNEFSCDGQLRRDATYLRPAAVRACAMGNSADGGTYAGGDKAGVAGNCGVPATKMR